MAAGHSETPLAKKLNLRDGQRVWFDGMPDDVQEEIAEYALELIFVREPEEGVDAAHVFVTKRADMAATLERLRHCLSRDGQIWVSWPESGELSETAIREAGEPLGLVDTKSCDVSDDWCGLKLVIRKDLR
ncbi:DUF3052 family protein [Aurantiacibacter rhizosphaerae]|uniref:DUF3052 family protein n=1 Tax=Aurantiacibacter rhizosphaerae TaxID=2691582 RepID=A0A844XDN0_9SPHN|nr:DUF3052 family protein [Aurantiacibacter rhizosphaerae]MWV28116.1 DUF3052 family protein [Aurantiacibacter rhizosphaerae]